MLPPGGVFCEYRSKNENVHVWQKLNYCWILIVELLLPWCVHVSCICVRFQSANSTSCDTTLHSCWKRWKSWKNEQFWKFKNDIIHVICLTSEQWYYCSYVVLFVVNLSYFAVSFVQPLLLRFMQAFVNKLKRFCLAWPTLYMN